MFSQPMVDTGKQLIIFLSTITATITASFNIFSNHESFVTPEIVSPSDTLPDLIRSN